MTDPLERSSAESASQQETDAEELISTALVYPQPLQAVSAALGVDMTVMSNFVPGANTGSEALSRLVQGWENYINDAKDQPIQMLQDLQLCGEGDLNLLTDGPSSFTQHLMQPELRHIRSSPLQWRPKVFDQEMDQEESNIMPPPIPLDPMQRSSSTPSSFRQNSMCTSIGTEGRSAFTLPSQRVNYTSSVTHPRRSAFDPVKYYACQLEDMERTSIEVMDMTPDKGPAQASTPQRRGAAFRAARFLEDVRVLSRRRRFGGKGKKGQNSKEKAGGDAKAESLAAPDTSITVITEPDYKSMLVAPEDMYSPPVQDTEVANNEEEPYQRIEAQLQSESPNSSPIRPQVVEDQAENQQEQTQYEHSLRIKYSSADKKLETLPSPSPTRMAAGDVSETESPGTARSSGSSSGHATQAASIGSSIAASGLSTISETDREVMETNKEARRRRVTGTIGAHTKNESDLASVHSSSTGSTATHCYLPVENSPILRDGANVPLDRFFTETALSTGQIITAFVRSQVSGMTRTQSGTTTSASTSEGTTGTHTTASISSQEGPPPTIVSYLERLPELVSLRETVESSSTRATGKEGEEREDSPAEMGNLLFEAAKASIERKHKSSSPAISQCVRHDKFRARPPRSPYMIPRSASTPSPTSSPLIIHHSPPRNIVDKPEPILVSRPHVMRSGNFMHANTFSLGRSMTTYEEEEEIIARRPKLSFMTGASGTSDAVNSGEMYHDESIEVLKSDSTDTMLTMPAMVTPEKN
ncbi:hypothetical protein FisN_6Hh335 [Fistulifera solaris]|uniref:Uncharacterized protein n=1 Tax=Fistulifera solaris TaxID=1519565 RepID=A0A1Z5K770_FISSO|nr:hypothetical protein FisN_6Hh335 [Fistulifera solaris]|eukprot:GAX22087.1 hypothetical protein FisN_6Hh335 [Fistulifera solaris]